MSSYITLNSAAELDDYELFLPVLRHWFSLKTDDRLPMLQEMQSSFQDYLADYRILAKVKHNPLDVFYAEAGAMLEALYGKKISGKNLNELYNDWFRKRAYEGFNICTSARLPVYEKRAISTIIIKIGYHKLHLPFQGEGQEINDVITYIIPLDRTWKIKEDWEKLVKMTPWL